LNGVCNVRGKYGIGYVNGLCISILHFLEKITTQQMAVYTETQWSSEKLLAKVDVSE
jgi:hypothetical protein